MKRQRIIISAKIKKAEPLAKKSKSQYYYAVRVGRKSGVYQSWDECQSQVIGYKGSVYKRFDVESHALAFISDTKTMIDEKPDKRSKSIAIDRPSDDRLIIWTDGACSNNGRVGARAGVGVWFGPDDERNISERLPGTQTNQRAEMYAGLRALQIVKMTEEKETKIEIMTDSTYLIKGITDWIYGWKSGGWKRKPKNEDLWKRLDVERSDVDVKWTYVKGHSGVLGNEEADKLATNGAKKDSVLE